MPFTYGATLVHQPAVLLTSLDPCLAVLVRTYNPACLSAGPTCWIKPSIADSQAASVVYWSRFPGRGEAITLSKKIPLTPAVLAAAMTLLIHCCRKLLLPTSPA